ncbi:hypothetical protein Salat_2631500 [Sesamum alatum]|uniref:Uncharacterized protein n=1 Tax=Sesamum alatum TaxID=300844 RepID=A0AAE1XPL0_9LAMI|nr:hypothetical protein Salat_2631500 [Sesamum alatum]
MNARVAEIARNLQRRNSPAAVIRLRNAEVVAAPAVDQPSEFFECQVSAPTEVAGSAFPGDTLTGPSAIITPSALAAIEIATSGSKGTSSEIEGAPAIERRAAKDAAKEEENTKHFKDLVTWWKQAREDFKTPSRRVAKMEGEKLNPDWAISARNFVLRTLVGQDSFELYKTCCQDRDQASAFGHNLALKCSMFRNDKADAEKKFTSSNRVSRVPRPRRKRHWRLGLLQMLGSLPWRLGY